MFEKEFSQRLAQLRSQQGISARDMSLSLGQNPGYINTIENGKSFPTMLNFFYICEFLHISPKDFFDTSISNPDKIHLLSEKLPLLSNEELDALTTLVNNLVKKS